MLSAFLLLSTLFLPFSPDTDPGTEIRTAVQRVLPDTEFALGDTALSGEEKSVSGTVTFRKKHQLGLKASYDTNDKLGTVSLSFPSGNGLGISDGAWQKMAGEKVVLTGRTTHLRLAAALDVLAGKGLLGDLDVPDFISGLTIDEVNLRFSPHHKWTRVLGETTLGSIDGYFYQDTDDKKKKKTEFLVVLRPKRDFRLSKIDDRLSLLDGIDLGKQKIVLNSKKLSKGKGKGKSKREWKIPSLDDVGDATANRLRQGVNFVAELDLKKINLDKLLKRGPWSSLLSSTVASTVWSLRPHSVSTCRLARRPISPILPSASRQPRRT